MPAAKLEASGTPDVMKPEGSVDSIVRQAVSKEPILYFPRASESPIQWLQLLHAIDQQGASNLYSEFPGWPLLYPLNLKVQLQKCDKCSEQFCSPINYRRHIRVHHRLKKHDKDSPITRDLLGAYWDKLSVEEAQEVLSFENVMLEEVPGSSIVNALTTLIHKQGLLLLPHYYVMAGAALLDIVQSKPSSFPISSQELFSVLDDASEKTCFFGTAVSMKTYMFDGDAGKIGLEPKNIVACTSFLLEQNLVKAWLADKDAEALRCQKQLVEEEEAAQKRQAEILKRKRQKKLRQKEQKARGQKHKGEAETKGDSDSTVKTLPSAEASLDTYKFEAHNPEKFANDTPSHVPFQSPDTNDRTDVNTQSGHDFGTDINEGTDGNNLLGHDFGTDQNVEGHSKQGHSEWRIARKSKKQRRKSQAEIKGNVDSTVKALSLAKASLDTYNFEAHNPRKFANDAPSHVPFQCSDINEGSDCDAQSGCDLGTDQNIERQSELRHNHWLIAVTRWQRPPKSQLALTNDLHTSKNSPISKPEVIEKYATRGDQRAAAIVDCNDAKPKPEIDRVVLKTIAEKEPDLGKNHEVLIGSISVNLGNCSQPEDNVVTSREDCMVENVAKQNHSQDKPFKPDLVTTGNNQSTVKPWMPVSQLETKDPVPVQSGGTEADEVYTNGDCQNLSSPRLCNIDGSDICSENNVSQLEGRIDPRRLQFSSHAAKAFLAQRWRDVMSSNHVKLVVSLDSEPPGCQKMQDSKTAACQSSDVDRCNNLANAEKSLLASSRVSKSKPRKKSGKRTNRKHAPK